jgi:hypothetical protein
LPVIAGNRCTLFNPSQELVSRERKIVQVCLHIEDGARLVAHGAVGMILISDPILEEIYPYSMQTRDLDFPQFRWLDKQGKPNDYFPELKGANALSKYSDWRAA